MGDLQQMFKEIFGDSLSSLTTFQQEQMSRLTGKFQELAKEAVKDEFTKLSADLLELKNRVTVLEAERAQKAADGIGSSF